VFDPIRVYDRPAVILGQIGNGVASTDSVRRALFDPAALSPRERESYTDDLKKELGDHSIINAAIDVLANPLTWLAFIAGGAAITKNFAASGRMFTGGLRSAGYGEWAKSKWPILRSIRALSLAQELHDTPIPALIERSAYNIEKKSGELAKTITPGVERILKMLSEKHGTRVTSMNPEDAPSAAIEHDLRMIEDVTHAKVLGYDKPHSFEYATKLERDKNIVRSMWVDENGNRREQMIHLPDEALEELRNRRGGVMLRRIVNGDNVSWGIEEIGNNIKTDYNSGRLRMYDLPESMAISGVKVKTEVHSRGVLVDAARLDELVREYGLEDHIAAVRKSVMDQKVLRYGNEPYYAETGQFVIDRAKVLREARANIKASGAVVGPDGNFNSDSINKINALMGDDFIQAMNEIRNRSPMGEHQNNREMLSPQGMSVQEIEDLVVNTQERVLSDPNYFPRNTAETYENVRGVKMRVDASNLSSPGEMVQNANRIAPSGRTRFRVRQEASWDPEDLRRMHRNLGGTEELLRMAEEAQETVDNIARSNPQGRYSVHRVAPHRAMSKYISSTARDYVFFNANAAEDPFVRAALADYRPTGKRMSTRYPGPLGKMETGGALASEYPFDPNSRFRNPAGGYSMWDIIDTQMRAVEEANGADGYVTKAMREHVLPSVFGLRTLEDGASHATHAFFKGTALKIANSEFMKEVESYGGVAERFVRSMRRFGNTPYDTTGFGSNVAKIFYGSTMGLNIGSALVNLQQPLHNLHQLGVKNVARAYAQSIKQMYAFAVDRASLGMNPSQVDVDNLIDKHFSRNLPGNVVVDLHTVADLKNSWGGVERAGYGSQMVSKGIIDNVFSFVMKPFQTAEMLNRLVTANSVLNAAEEGWAMRGSNTIKALDPIRAVEDARQAVEAMQFGSSPMNRPVMFYKGFLANPAIRQFLQFPVRSMVNFATIPDMVGGTRTLGVGPLSMEVSGETAIGRMGIRSMDFVRALGYSAIAYDVMKNIAGADISRGLLVGFMPKIDVDRDKELQLPVPPFMDAGYQVIRGVMSGGDAEIMSNVTPLIIPGGVSISRALGSMGPSETLQAIGLQKKYAAWDKIDQNGNVPMFDSDDRYLGSYSASDMVLKGMGTDLGRFGNQTEVTQFLLKNRDQMRDLRRQWIANVLGNNMQKAMSIKAQFEKQFGMPLTVTQQQMREAVKMREQSVADRTMDTIDKDLQQQYRDLLSQTNPNMLSTSPFAVNEQARYVWSQLPKR